MADKMTPQDLGELASRIAEEIISRLGRTLESTGVGPVSKCGPTFAQCGTYACSGNFECNKDFICTGKYNIVKVPKLQIDGGCGGGHAFSQCGDYACEKEFRCETAKFICASAFKDSPDIAGMP